MERKREKDRGRQRKREKERKIDRDRRKESHVTSPASYIHILIYHLTLCLLASFDVVYSENQAVGTTLLTASATDEDSDELTFSITSSVPSNMVLGELTGEIVLIAPFDYEAIQVITFDLQVSDGDNSSPSETVTITLTDYNDNAPIFTNNGIYR